jgi:hypothetical protein
MLFFAHAIAAAPCFAYNADPRQALLRFPSTIAEPWQERVD